MQKTFFTSNQKYNNSLIVPETLPDLPECLEEKAGIKSEYSENRRMISLAPESSYDPSESLFSTIDGETSAVFKLGSPYKRQKIDLDSTTSSKSDTIHEDDVVVGQIHPTNNSETVYLDNLEFEDPGSPLDRSTPISDYDLAETEVGVAETSTLNSSEDQPIEDPPQPRKTPKITSYIKKHQCYAKSPPPPRNFL